jgi:hypothetical protein
MKQRMMLSLFPLLLAMFMLAGSNTAEAAVSVGIGIGGGHHYSGGGAVVEYRTSDPVYTTWYPDSSVTYVAPPVYYSSPTYVYDPYVYSTPSVGFNAWFGSDNRHSRYTGRGYSGGGGHRR